MAWRRLGGRTPWIRRLLEVVTRARRTTEEAHDQAAKAERLIESYRDMDRTVGRRRPNGAPGG